MTNVLKPHIVYTRVGGPTKLDQSREMTPELAATFKEVAARIAASKADKPPEVHISPHRGSYRKTSLKTGMIFGHLILRRKAGVKRGVKPTLREQWHCECVAPCDWKPGGKCNSMHIIPKYYLIRQPNPKTHCGCQFQTNKSRHAREYRIYHMMHQRCMNPRHESYEHYKKRGITIYEPWQKHNEDGFDLWLADVGPCPDGNYSLDRIRNSEGYFPGNIKWSTPQEQRLNQGDLIGGKNQDEIAEMGMTEDEWVAHAKIHGYF